MHSELTGSYRYFPRYVGDGWCIVAFVLTVFTCGLSHGENDAAKSPGPPGWLGLAIDDSLVPGRLVVVEVDAGGPAAKAGVRIQDMVLAIDGEPTLDAERFAAAIATIDPGENVRFSIARGGTVEEFALIAAKSPQPNVSEPTVTTPAISAPAGVADAKGSIADEPAPPSRSAFGLPASPVPAVRDLAPQAAAPAPATFVPKFSAPPPAQDPWQRSNGSATATQPLPADHGRGKTALGVRTVPVDPIVQARYSLTEPTGALVVGLVDDLPASRAGLPTGSVIVAFDRQPVRSPAELTRLVSAGPTDRPVKLEYILPGGESRAAEISLVNIPATAAPSHVDSAASTEPDGLEVGIGGEIRELRRTIESLTKRLDELEQRALERR